jgi:hypothetical protein
VTCTAALRSIPNAAPTPSAVATLVRNGTSSNSQVSPNASTATGIAAMKTTCSDSVKARR